MNDNNVNKKTCFVLMPFTVKDDSYSDPNHWSEVYNGLIVPACKIADFTPIRDDEDRGSRFIVHDILRKIENADIILCDLSSYNPNVFLELGWTLRADKPFVLIKDDRTSFTFDLNQQYTQVYNHKLQPMVLRKNIDDLAVTISLTQNDTENRCSLLKTLGLEHQAIQTAQSGDAQMQMILQIEQTVKQIASCFGNNNKQEYFPWPSLLRSANSVLFEIKDLWENMDNNNINYISDFRQHLINRGLYRCEDIQVSILGKNRRFIFHDWEQMIGKKTQYIGLDGMDMYDTIFASPFGVVAWVDRNTNIPHQISNTSLRHSIAIFIESREQDIVVVEVHYSPM